MGVDDIAFHRQVFALDHLTPAAFATLLWQLPRRQTDRATGRVADWTRSVVGLTEYSRTFGRRNTEAARLAGELQCPLGTVSALAALGEQWDGSGFPHRLAGERIPIVARVLAVAQMVAIWGEEASAGEVAHRLLPLGGGRFDPVVVRETVAYLDGGLPGGPAGWIDALAGSLGSLDPPPTAGPPVTVTTLAGVFAEIVDAKSPFTASHSRRVAALAGAMVRRAGDPDGDQAGVLLAGLLHDLGKLAVPNTILDKDAPLSDDEWAIVRRHPADSARIIARVPDWTGIAAWVAAHHERPDGRGYDRGLRAEAIPPVGRLLAVADAFDAMTADRPYRAGLAPEEALRRLAAGRGAQFDPAAVALLKGVVDR